MAEHKNFYENLEEALNRLRNTIVLYDNEPYYIWTITNHKGDGVFRVYMSKVADVSKGVPSALSIGHTSASLGPAMDQHVDGNAKNPAQPIFRKKMDSSYFNKFRPFPLGMMNLTGHAIYMERTPARPSMLQGLSHNMISAILIDANGGSRTAVNPNCSEFHDCVVGDYPSPKEALEGVTSDKTKNSSIAFNREFALIRGPIDTVFIAYRGDVVGALLLGDFSVLRLGRKYKHLKEAVKDLNLFASVE